MVSSPRASLALTVCEYRILDRLTPNTVELIPTIGALFPRGGPAQDSVLTLPEPCAVGANEAPGKLSYEPESVDYFRVVEGLHGRNTGVPRSYETAPP